MFRRAAAAVLLIILLFASASAALAQERETPSGIPFSELESFVDGYMDKYIGKTSPGAAVAVVKDGKIVFSKGYGYADSEKKIPVSPSQTVFEYGSISKVFVWTAVMRLWEEGKIDLNADIRSYLPEGFPIELRYEKPVTMLNIMSHTAGFEDYLFDVLLPNAKTAPSFLETLMNCRPEQVYEPGTVVAYSNYSAALAAYIAERLSGKEFYEYVAEYMLDPLQMENTTAHPLLEDRPELKEKRAKGYAPLGEGRFKEGWWSYVPLYPIGGVNGTAEDLARFAMAFLPPEGEPGPLFDKSETLREMLSESYPMGPGIPGFAHGLIEWEGEHMVFGHGGNTAFFSTQLNIVPEDRFGVVVLTNAAGEMDISSGLTQALTGKRNKALPAAGTDLPNLEAVEGSYIPARRMHNGFLELYAYLNMLRVDIAEQGRIRLSAAGVYGEYVETSPYVFERVKAEGPLFSYNFDKIFFEMKDGKVFRMTGDFTPLPEGRTEPFLIACAAMGAVSALYFMITPVVLLIRKLGKKKAGAKASPPNRRMMRFSVFITLCGTALFANNALLILRMLINNYRSFSEMRPQILLNYPLAAAAAVIISLTLVNFKKAELTKRQKTFCVVSVIMIAMLIGLLAEWQFFTVIC